jgi:hypothetical protein
MKRIRKPTNPNDLWCGGCEKFEFVGLFTWAQKKETGGLVSLSLDQKL